MNRVKTITAKIKPHSRLYRSLLLLFYMVRFFYHTIRTRSYWFLRYYPGHYGSTLPATRDIQRRANRLFAKQARACAGIDTGEDRQIELLNSFSTYYADFSFPSLPASDTRYYYENPMYGYCDGFILYAFLRHFRPRQVVEVGSGFSSALMLDTADRYPDAGTRFTFIEPFPRRLNRLVRHPTDGRCRIVQKNVQEVPFSVFVSLTENDILFVDSSHVVKIGSDLSYILFHILPALNKGVLVHIHDIWWPFEYPRTMIMEGRIWNEPYFVRSFLQFNQAFEILYFTSYMEEAYRSQIDELLPGYLRADTGRSLWLRKKE